MKSFFISIPNMIFKFSFSQCRQDQCDNVRFMLQVCQVVGNGLMREESPFSKFRPCLILVGSVAEGTRIESASETDVHMYFDALGTIGISLL